MFMHHACFFFVHKFCFLVNDLVSSGGFFLIISRVCFKSVLNIVTLPTMDANRRSRVGEYDHDDVPGARRRFVDRVNHDREDDEHVYEELVRLRNVVAGMEGEKDKGCLSLGLNNSAMSTIFGLVFAVIVTVSVYAFVNLYRALVKRFL